jgi:lipid-binding SYLF domain-containing protein
VARTSHLILILTIVISSAASATGQKPAGGKFNDAIKRSEGSAGIISMVAQLSQNDIPKNLIEQAAAIGVFPCKKTDLLIEHAILCPGVIVSRTQNGWSLPAFYRFGGGGFGRPDPALSQSNALILLFMARQPVDWLGKASILRNMREAVAGPLGSITEAQTSALIKASVIAYALRKDTLSGEILKSDFWRGIGLVEDNNINAPLYGIKGREVLAGRKIVSASLPAGISAFQEAVQKHWPVPRSTP